MSKQTKDRLYNLMPAVYRIHDSKNGEPLRALLGVIEEEVRGLEEDIGGLYEDWFIETCDEWIIPYIADLLDIKDLHPLSGKTWSLRSYVANTLAYRRRKGSLQVLEQVAWDVTGWPAHAAEIFPLVSTTQHLNSLHLQRVGSVDLKRGKDLELMGSPFESTFTPHIAEVRGISGEGKYSPFKVGLFLWRLQSVPLRNVTASKAEGVRGGYRFDPTGRDISLFNQPQTETKLAHISEEANLPGRLRRISLQEDLGVLRRGKSRGISFFRPNPVFSVLIAEEREVLEIPPHDVFIGDLSRWNSLPRDRDFLTRADPSDVRKVRMLAADFWGGDRWRPDSVVELIKPGKEKERPGMMARILIVDEDEASLTMDRDISAAVEDRSVMLRKRSVIVDPELGRLILNRDFGEVLVSYSCGFCADIGAGPWDHSSSLSRMLYRSIDWRVGVSRELEANGKTIFSTLAEAVREWKKQPDGIVGAIALMDSRTYSEDLELEIPEGSQLLIIAADGAFMSRSQLEPSGLTGNLNLSGGGVRPHLEGNIRVKGLAGESSSDPGELVLSGLLINGKLTVVGGNLGGIVISHCTMVPKETSLEVMMDGSMENDSLRLFIDRSICGGLCLPGHLAHFEIEESIIDGMSGIALNAAEAVAQVERSTILGKSVLMGIYASDSIFTDEVAAKQKNIGCIRFCYLPAGSRTPRRFCCLPDLAMEEEARRQKLLSSKDLSKRACQSVEAKTRPTFTSLRYGDPGYCQLSLNTAQKVRRGAENGSEMGAFNSLQHHQRRANLRTALEEYMRFGMEAGLFFQT